MRGQRGYRPFEWSRGVLNVYGDLANLTRPRLRHGLEHGWVGLTFEISDGNSDPFVALTINVSDTRLGEWILAAAARWDKRKRAN